MEWYSLRRIVQLNKTLKNHYDVGIYGWWGHDNFGGCLTYYALNTVISQMGYSVLMIQEANGLPGRYDIPDNCIAMQFASAHYDCTAQCNINEMFMYNDLCDTFVVGGDQMWSFYIPFVKEDNFLNFVDDSKNKVSYSTSFGPKNFTPPQEFVAKVRPLLQRFNSVSVREDYAVDIAKRIYNVEAVQVIDAVFLLKKEDYINAASDSTFVFPDKFLFAFILDPTDNKRRQIECIAKKLGLEIVCAPDAASGRHKIFAEIFAGLNIITPLNISNFLKAYEKASYIVTDSFHGTCFSYIFKKNFNVYYNNLRGADRFVSLMDMLQLQTRRIYENQTDYDLLISSDVEPNIDWSKADNNVLIAVNSSRSWLKKALSYSKYNNICENNLLENSKKLFNIKSIDNYIDVKKECTGCGACKNICPVDAISIIPNEDGFFNPIIEREKCVNCGLCSKHCIVLDHKYLHNSAPDCYAVCADDNTRETSSSGGAFTVIATNIIKNDGIVCGAAFDSEFNVIHKIAHKIDDLEELKGSKYYQSNTGFVFREIKNNLESGKTVLFTGMPCQVAGLCSFLGKDYPNLYTVDLLCHGITSKKVFDKYSQDIFHGKKLLDVKFKAKKPWGWHAGVNAVFQDGSTYSKPLETDLFYVAYLQGVSKNTPCGNCLFNHLPRQGDITIGDFWGIEKFDKNLNDNKGTSLVLVNSEKGKNLLKSILGNFARYKKVPLSYAISGNGSISHPYNLASSRNDFFLNLDKASFSFLVNKYRPRDKNALLNSLPAEFKEYFYLSEIIMRYKGNRKLAVWGENRQFSDFIARYYGVNVECNLTIYKEKIKNGRMKLFDELKGKVSEYYVVVMGREYTQSDAEKFLSYGYVSLKDYVYRIINPIVLENFNLAKGYVDLYGNVVEKSNGIIKRIIFRGCNNKINIQPNVNNLHNLTIDVCANSSINIGTKTSFNSANMGIETKGYNGTSRIVIGNTCAFMDGLMRLYNHSEESAIQINEQSTFGEELKLHANSGKKILIGRDCMFSRSIIIFSGDGHAIMDVNTGKVINNYSKTDISKNYAFVGDHTWIGIRAFILSGTSIGEGSIVGAQSVVKGRFPNNCSIAGSPAKIIKQDIAWSRDPAATDIGRCAGYAKHSSYAEQPLYGKKVLVVGGTNFIGPYLVKRLLELGNKVTIATRGQHSDSFGDSIKRIRVDLFNRDMARKVFTGKHYDVIFNDIAYCAQSVKNVLDFCTCDRYIQISSAEVYNVKKSHISEKDLKTHKIKIDDGLIVKGMTSNEYAIGKRQAEAMAYKLHKNSVIVRLPMVAPTPNLCFYSNCILDDVSMCVHNISSPISIVLNSDVGYFLPWIATQHFVGAINFCSKESVTVKQIIDYIELKTNKNASFDDVNGKQDPFYSNAVSLSVEKLYSLGYEMPSLHSWIWKMLDNYINQKSGKR